MKFALLGATGYVGSVFQKHLKDSGFHCKTISRQDCNVVDIESLTNHLGQLAPDFLINCAGYTGKPNVDACELDKTNCLQGNAILPGIISTACQKLSITWGHVSSGCIFTGTRPDGLGFAESDAPNFSFRTNNCSFYSGTKALGEEILTDDPNCYIWRLRIPFNNVDSPRNYISKLRNYKTLLEAENSLSNLEEFVAACVDCFTKGLPTGIYNLTNPGSVTTSQVVELMQQHGLIDRPVKFFDSESDFMEKAAKTPRSNCVLDSSKALNAGLKLSPILESLADAMKNWSQPA